MNRREDDMNRAVAHQKMARILTIQTVTFNRWQDKIRADAAEQYRIARALMGLTDADQVYS